MKKRLPALYYFWFLELAIQRGDRTGAARARRALLKRGFRVELVRADRISQGQTADPTDPVTGAQGAAP